jgi:hypothetical protein
MSAIAINPVAINTPDTRGDIWAVGLFGLLLSALALAQTANDVDQSMMIDEVQIEEIYDNADDWRETETETEAVAEIDLDAWRDTEPEPELQVAPKSRMQFGLQSVYDDPRIRRDQAPTTLDLDFDNEKPSSAFQFKF